ncbi:MAG: hypothetical protein V1808_04195 [Candidatus Daviesbacteria bacterium]
MPKNSPLLVDLGQGLSIMSGLPTIGSWNTAGRPKNAKRGTFGFNFQANKLEYWDGNDWHESQMSEN